MTINKGNNKFGHRNRASCFLFVVALVTAAVLIPAKNSTAQDVPDETITLNLKNVDIQSLIETVSIHTGKNFIIDPNVKAIVNVVSSEPVNATKLYELFLAVLEVNGYAAVQTGPFTKIVPSSVGVQSAVPLLSEHSDVRDELVSRVIQLESMPVLQVIDTLRPLVSETASLSAESTSNSIIVTDHAANIEKLIELIFLMDGR